MAQQPMTLDQMLQIYQQLVADYQARRIDPAGFRANLARLQAVDSEGRWWACTPDGSFLWYDGTRWVPGQPPGLAAQRPAAQAPMRSVQQPAQAQKPAQQVQPQQAKPQAQQAQPMQTQVAQPSAAPSAAGKPAGQAPASFSQAGAAAASGVANALRTAASSDKDSFDLVRKNTLMQRFLGFAKSPLLAIIPSAVIGGLWFLYTLIRVREEGWRGVDFLTPIILAGTPLLLGLLHKPLDNLLRPVQGLKKRIPSAFRLGAAFALPVVMGCGCSALQSSGFSSMWFNSLVSILFAYFLLHTPAEA